MKNILIKVDQLGKICTRLPTPIAVLVVAAINKVCPQYGMTTDILHEFLANVIHESKEFTRYEENLNYSAKRLTEVWPTRFKTLEEAIPYANNPQKLACKVYGGRLGNNDPLDGWEFRGSGPIQMTGKDHFIKFSSWMDRKFKVTKTEKEWAALIRNDHQMAMHSACWIFSIAKGLNDEAENDNMRLIIKKINGGYIGATCRTMYYKLCKEHL